MIARIPASIFARADTFAEWIVIFGGAKAQIVELVVEDGLLVAC